MRLKRYIKEIFNKPVKFERQSSGTYNSTEYQFEIDEKLYEVKFYDPDVAEFPDSHEVIFVLTRVGGDRVRGFDTEKITGTGDSIAVFSTVANILKDFIQNYKPDILYFAAKEQSRIKLYKKLSKKLSSMSYLKNNYMTTYKNKKWFISSQEELDPVNFMKEVS